MRTRRQLAAVAILFGCTAGMLTACGDDDSDTTTGAPTTEADAGTEAPEADTTTEAAPGTDEGTGTEASSTGGDDTEFCTAYADVSAAFEGPPDPETITPLLETLDAEAPEEIADPLGVMTDAIRTALDSGGEDSSPFEDPEFVEAQSEVDPYAFENCDYDAKIEVTATEYAFEGIPDEIDAGTVAFLLTNEGNESHEIGLARKKDDVTESFDELLEMDQEEAETKIDFAGGAFAASNGDQGLAIADLEPGEYIAACFIPVGTSMEGDDMQEGDGPPHFTQGMKAEFTVS
ncbi:hypothetical protein BH20ACT3_BH20ACT3_07160 [soil metagenome]